MNEWVVSGGGHEEGSQLGLQEDDQVIMALEMWGSC